MKGRLLLQLLLEAVYKQLSEAVLEAAAIQQLGLFSDTRLRLHLVQTLLSPPASGQTTARLPAMYRIVTGLPALLSRNSCTTTQLEVLLHVPNDNFHFQEIVFNKNLEKQNIV